MLFLSWFNGPLSFGWIEVTKKAPTVRINPTVSIKEKNDSKGKVQTYNSARSLARGPRGDGGHGCFLHESIEMIEGKAIE